MKGLGLAVLILGLSLVGLLVLGVLEDPATEETAQRDAPLPSARSTATHGDGANDASTSVTDAPTAGAGVSHALLPRVLPPDAAIEDVRDAFATKDVTLVRGAYEQLARMSAKSASFSAALQRLADQESDAAVARIVSFARRKQWVELSESERRQLLSGVRTPK